MIQVVYLAFLPTEQHIFSLIRTIVLYLIRNLKKQNKINKKNWLYAPGMENEFSDSTKKNVCRHELN